MIQYLRHLICTLTLTALSTITMNAAEANIQLASDAWPPFTNEVGKARLAIEIVHLALARSGYVPETTILDTWTIQSDLKSDKYHGCGAIWKSVEREKYLLFSKPYLESRLHLVDKKGSDASRWDLQPRAKA